MATKQVRFSASGVVDVAVDVQERLDTVTTFGTASGPAICPPEIDVPVVEFDVTLTFPFPVILEDDRLQDGTLTLGFERLDAEDEDYSDDVTVSLEYPFSGEADTCFHAVNGREISLTVTVTGDEPAGRCGALYERHSW